MCKTLQNHQCPTLPAFVETRNHHAKRCKKVKNVAKKNGDIITIMRHYEYINMKSEERKKGKQKGIVVKVVNV